MIRLFARLLVVLMVTTIVLEQFAIKDPSVLIEVMDADEKENEGEEKEQKDEVEKDKFFKSPYHFFTF